jgi:glucose-1-phosphate adenylyltransferase
MGIYVFKREALISLLRQDERQDFGYHLIDTAVKKGKTYSHIYCGYWEDIGTVASYYEANLMLTKASKGLDTYDEKNPIYSRPTYLPGPRIRCTKVTDSIICEGSIIEAEEISHSVIGLRSHIKRGTIIRDTVMMGNHFYMPPSQDGKPLPHDFWIGEDCLIERAIIDEHVKIGNRVKLINEKKLETYESDGIFIRDGIIIVTAGTQIPDHFIL